MPLNLDAYLGVHSAALKLRSQRTELLANNLANSDTPNFRARDIDFKEALAKATHADGSVQLTSTNQSHLGTVGANGSSAELKYRTPLAPSLDGNTVDPQLEQSAFAENAVHYQTTLAFLGAKFRNLMTAITGQ